MPEHEPKLFGEKRCTKCELMKHFFCFPPAKDMVDGLGSWCRDCGNEDRRERERKKSLTKGLHNATGVGLRGSRPDSFPKGPTFEDWKDVT